MIIKTNKEMAGVLKYLNAEEKLDFIQSQKMRTDYHGGLMLNYVSGRLELFSELTREEEETGLWFDTVWCNRVNRFVVLEEVSDECDE